MSRMGLEEILALGPGSAALIEQLRLWCATREEFDTILSGLFRDVSAELIHDFEKLDDHSLRRLENDEERSPLIRLCAGYLWRWREANA